MPRVHDVVRALPTIAERQRALLRWYRQHGRHDLPWRHGITPYRVLVSEIMLQQTQVDRVVPYFNKWMRRWPTVEHLARARRASVLRAWAGLGYNRRAVYLHRAAQEIAREGWFGSGFSPSILEGESKRGWSVTRRGRAKSDADIAMLSCSLERLPGIGSYTANALLAFAWNLPAPCVDTNVRRVLAYAILRRPSIMDRPFADLERVVARHIPSGRGRDWHYALMDYGALVLTARKVPKRQQPTRAQGTFKDSNRFWRGRIVAVLREQRQGSTRAQLHRTLKHYGTPPRALTPLLRALERDGVIVARGKHLQLA